MASLAFFETVFAHGSVGLAFVTPDFCFQYVNETLAEINGIPAKAHIGCTVAEIVGEESWSYLKPLYNIALSGQDTIKMPLSSSNPKSNISRHVIASYHGVKRGEEVIGIAVVIEDNTQRVQAETAMREMASRQRSFLRDMLKSVTDGKLRLCDSITDLPANLDHCSRWLDLGEQWGIRTLRDTLIELADAHKLTPERILDMEVASGEAAMNAVVHAGGGRARVCVNDDGVAQVWIVDVGKGISVENLPRATLEKGFTTEGTMGLGMKMMLKTVDRIYLLTGAEGTTVVLEQEKHAPLPEWMRDDIHLPGELHAAMLRMQ